MTRRAPLVAALIATVLLSSVLLAVGRPLTTDATPLGVVSYEFAATAARGEAILAGWGPAGQRVAMQVQALDCLFPVAYGSLGALLAVRRGVGRAGVLCWLVAAAFDELVENPMLDLGLWTGHVTPVTMAIGTTGATVKFVAIVLGILALVRGRR